MSRMTLSIPYVSSRALPSPDGISEDGVMLLVNLAELAATPALSTLLDKPKSPNPRRVSEVHKTASYRRLERVFQGADTSAVHLAHQGVQILARKVTTDEGMAKVVLDSTADTGDLNGRTSLAVARALGEDGSLSTDVHVWFSVIVRESTDDVLAIAEGRNYSTNVQGSDLAHAAGELEPIKQALGERANEISWYHGDEGEPAAHHIVARLALVAAARGEFAPTGVYGRGRSIATKYAKEVEEDKGKGAAIERVLPDAVEALNAWDHMQATVKSHVNTGQERFGARSVAVQDQEYGHVLHDSVAYLAFYGTVRALWITGGRTSIDWSEFSSLWRKSASKIVDEVTERMAEKGDGRSTSTIARDAAMFSAVYSIALEQAI